jgi:sulfur transfer complex TusBCD TusB component (DsrH family)
LRKILYLVKHSLSAHADVFVSDQTPNSEVSVVLLQDGVTRTHLAAHRVYALSDDVAARHVTPSYPVISYTDMLRMIFEADAVIAL